MRPNGAEDRLSVFMNVLRTTKLLANRLLWPLNIRLESGTAERVEMERLQLLEQSGHFERPIFPVLDQFRRCDPSLILAEVKRYESRFASFASESKGDTDFSLANDYYTSPDAEVLYAMVHLHHPSRVIEVGSGNSTKLFRHAIADAGLNTKLISIDPHPRCEVVEYSDELIQARVEAMGEMSLFAQLVAGDFLFIDSSHEVKAGNDVVFILLNIVPTLAPGVIIHFHDIFLPFEYPRDWVIGQRWNWTEQYFIQGMLQESSRFEVLWAGYYFQKTLSDFADSFRFCNGRLARSIWLRRLGGPSSG